MWVSRQLAPYTLCQGVTVNARQARDYFAVTCKVSTPISQEGNSTITVYLLYPARGTPYDARIN
jgi:hypothetical protein